MRRTPFLAAAACAAAVLVPPAAVSAQTAPAPAAPSVTSAPRAVDVGKPSLVTVLGTPGATVELHAYSRPSTTYRVVRRGVLDAAGRAAWTITPGGNTRLFARVAGASTPTTTVNVRHSVTIGARDLGDAHLFFGTVRPGATGLPVTLLRAQPGGGAAVLARTTTSPFGTWSVDRRLAGSGTAVVYAVTGSTSDHVSGRSRDYGLVLRP